MPSFKTIRKLSSAASHFPFLDGPNVGPWGQRPLFIMDAHNDPQLAVETGLLGFALMLWFLVQVYRHGLPTSRRWEFRWDGALSLAALLGCTGILVHSFVDFNLQIPANAALFYVLCALAASGLSPAPSRSRQTQPEELRKFRNRPATRENTDC